MDAPGTGITYGNPNITPNTPHDTEEFYIELDETLPFKIQGHPYYKLVRYTNKQKKERAAKRAALNKYSKAEAAKYDEQQRKLREELDAELLEERKKRNAIKAAANKAKANAAAFNAAYGATPNAAANARFKNDPYGFVYGKGGRRTRRRRKSRQTRTRK